MKRLKLPFTKAHFTLGVDWPDAVSLQSHGATLAPIWAGFRCGRV